MQFSTNVLCSLNLISNTVMVVMKTVGKFFEFVITNFFGSQRRLVYAKYTLDLPMYRSYTSLSAVSVSTISR